MGRISVIDQIESAFGGKSISEIMTEAQGKGNYKAMAEYLGVKKSSVYKLMDLCGLNKKNGNGTQPMDIPKSESEKTELERQVESFLMTKELGGKTKATIHFYRVILKRFAWWLDHEKIPQELKSLTTDVIRKFLHYIQTAPVRFGGHAPRSRKPASRSTVDAYYRTLSAFCAWVVREGLIQKEQNPMLRIDRPGQNKVVIPEIPNDHLEKLFATFGDDFEGRRSKAIALVLLDTGIRLSELAGISLDDLNLETGILKVLGKGQKERFVHIVEYTLEAVKSYLEYRDQVCKGPQAALWLTRQGKPLTKDGLMSLIRRFSRLVPGSHMNPHKFRHTFAILYLRNGGDLATLQDNGGWSDLNMLNRYAAARRKEDAHRVHETASPVLNFIDREKKRKREERENEASESDK